jgi:hypothetical protein
MVMVEATPAGTTTVVVTTAGVSHTALTVCTAPAAVVMAAAIDPSSSIKLEKISRRFTDLEKALEAPFLFMPAPLVG